MKRVLIASSLSFSALALLLSFVSAQKYGAIFIAVFIADAIALTCLLALKFRRHQLNWLNLAIGVLIIYTLADVTLRFLGFGYLFGLIGSISGSGAVLASVCGGEFHG